MFAVFILVSQGCYDEVKLRHLLENAIKSGTFGYFKVSMEGFCFQALDSKLFMYITNKKQIFLPAVVYDLAKLVVNKDMRKSINVNI